MNGRMLAIGAALLAAAAIVAWTLSGGAEPTQRPDVEAPRAGPAERAPGPKSRRTAPGAPDKPAEPAASSGQDESGAKPMLARFRVTSKADGLPLAGARIRVESATWEDADPIDLVADAEGRARMPQAMRWSSISVEAAAKGFVLDRLEFPAKWSDDELALSLAPGIDVSGRVVDDRTGDPIEEAKVLAYGPENSVLDPKGVAPLLVAHTTTDASGAFVLEGFPPSTDRSFLRVSAPFHMDAIVHPEGVPPPLVVRLEPAGQVRGVVRGPDGKPVGGATVTASAREHAEGDEYHETAKSAADGTYLVERLRPGGAYDLTADADGFAGAGTPEPVVVPQEQREVARDLVLRRAASLTVVVLDEEGRPARDAAVAIAGDNPQDAPDGRVTFHGLEPPGYEVRAWTETSAEVATEVTLTEGEAKTVEIRLTPPLAIEGVVVDDAGEPIEAAVIRAPGHDIGPATSGAHGDFRLEVRTAAVVSITAVAGGHASPVAAAGPADSPVRIEMAREATVRFRLRPPKSTGALSTAWRFLGAHGQPLAQGGKAVGDSATSVRGPVTARRVEIHVEGYLPVVLDVRPVPGDVTDLGDVMLDLGAGVRGRVVARDGTALKDAIVVVTRGELSASREVPSDGSFEFRGFTAGPVRITAYADGRLDADVDAEAARDPEPVTITLRRGCVVRVRVTDAGGYSLADAKVRLAGADGDPPYWFAEIKAGTWEARLPAGKWRVVATRGDASAEAAVECAEGATRNAVLTLAR